MRQSVLSLLRFIGAFALLLSLFVAECRADVIGDYQPVSFGCRDKSGKLFKAVRSFTLNGIPNYLLINPATLTSAIRPVSQLTKSPSDTAAISATGFEKTLSKATTPPVRLQNHGIVNAAGKTNGYILTVDLCPSKRPTELAMFDALAAIAKKTGKPTPVAIAITGLWLKEHLDDLKRIKELERQGFLSITWVNHSLTHPYDPGVPLSKTFLLTPGLDPRHEILTSEITMLEHGLVPSLFFRFPGLVADEKLIALLKELSLIPLGADAWLAKGEQPKPGSIILVHGNGNEPKGIAKLMPILQSMRPNGLISLSEALSANK